MRDSGYVSILTGAPGRRLWNHCVALPARPKRTWLTESVPVSGTILQADGILAMDKHWF